MLVSILVFSEMSVSQVYIFVYKRIIVYALSLTDFYILLVLPVSLLSAVYALRIFSFSDGS